MEDSLVWSSIANSISSRRFAERQWKGAQGIREFLFAPLAFSLSNPRRRRLVIPTQAISFLSFEKRTLSSLQRVANRLPNGCVLNRAAPIGDNREPGF